MDWLGVLKNYILVIENKGFSKAAEKKYANPSALSKQISALEENLGVELLRRTTRQLAMTGEGEVLYQQAKELLAQFEQLKEQVQHHKIQLEGEVSLTASSTFAESLLAPCIENFLLQHPAVDLNLHITNDYINLTRENIDIAIRSGGIDEKSYHAEPLLESSVGIFAAPSYVKKNSINSIEELKTHDCLVHADFKPHNLWRFNNKRYIEVQPKLLCNNLQILKSAAIAGRGIIYLAEYALFKELQAGTLIPLLKNQWSSPMTYSLVYLRQSYQSKRVNTLIAAIKKEFSSERARC